MASLDDVKRILGRLDEKSILQELLTRKELLEDLDLSKLNANSVPKNTKIIKDALQENKQNNQSNVVSNGTDEPWPKRKELLTKFE